MLRPPLSAVELPSLLIRGAQVHTPGSGLSEPCDVRIERGIIAEMAPQLPDLDSEVVFGTGAILAPAFVDLLACAREPGDEHEEDLQSLSECAVAGGYTAVVVSPLTEPSNDDHAVTELIIRRAREHGLCELLPQGALTHRCEGKSLATMGEMAEAGAVCFGDGDRPVQSARLLRHALEYARGFNRPVFVQPLDVDLAGQGVMHEGPWSTRLGLRGCPAAAESVIVARDIAVAQLAHGRLHFARITCRRSVELIRQAKAQGVAVTAAVTPWHLRYTDAQLQDYASQWKFVSPLRGEDDRQALLEGLRDGTIDAIGSDHMPENIGDKEVEFDLASPGSISLQTVLPLVLDCVRAGELPLYIALDALVAGPRRVLGLPGAEIRPGRTATLTLLGPRQTWTLDGATSRSKSHNTPVWGHELQGQVLLTLLRGRVVHQA